MMSAAKMKQMRLSELLIGIANVAAEADRPISGLKIDSREVKSGDLFFALKGRTHDGAAFIDDAVAKGAAAVVWEVEDGAAAMNPSWRTSAHGRRIPLIPVVNLSSQVGVIADRFYASPSKALFVVGVTGTNGKTSCSQYLAQALSEDAPCGVMGTLGAGIYGDLKAMNHTTPDALRCHEWLADTRDAGAASVAMEVSSHALDQGRVNGIAFDCAVFTNLSRDHLDYHGDMQRYGESKRSLFTIEGLRYAVINVDDPFGRELAAILPEHIQVIRYGLDSSNNPDVLGQALKLDAHGLTVQVQSSWGNGELHAPLLGRFNASNLLAVLSVLMLKGVPFAQALSRLQALTPVAGRMECLGDDEQPLVVVDYAHTPDALEQALTALREHCRGRLWCVFGCGGDRDQGKRPLMGGVAERLADEVVLTNDNPRGEDPMQILVDIRGGVSNEEHIHIEPDRARAIAFAIARAEVGDVVLIAGKGHEDYQIVGEEKRPFSDLQEARNNLGAA